VALWHPELISHLFIVGVPYARPMEKYFSIEDLVANAAPHFAYQIQFASGNLEKVIRSKGEIHQFLSALYGGRTEKRELGFDSTKGVLLDKLPYMKPSRLLSEVVSHLYRPQSQDLVTVEIKLTNLRSWITILLSLRAMASTAHV
jgi:hypothetical protein